jgi:hypothetical protein
MAGATPFTSFAPPVNILYMLADNANIKLAPTRPDHRQPAIRNQRPQQFAGVGGAGIGTEGRRGARRVPWFTDAGVPFLHDCTRWIRCEAAGFAPGGDHLIVIGLVVSAKTARGRPSRTAHGASVRAAPGSAQLSLS